MANTAGTEDLGLGWNDMLCIIKRVLQMPQINHAEVIRILSSYQSKESDWERYAIFDEKEYTRNLVDSRDDVYNLMIMAWGPGQGSCIHDHANSSCFVKVLAGTIQEIRYDVPKRGEELSVLGDYARKRDDVTYIDDSIGVHEMKNASEVPVVTLHIYVPPYSTCKEYDRKTSAVICQCKFGFKSIYGKIVKG